MRNLLILAVVGLITASSAGCFHRNACCGGGGGLFSWRPQQPQAQYVQYSDPCCGQQAVPCCPPQPCCP
jgi:hypothetical protein